jgi:hypothetical protein
MPHTGSKLRSLKIEFFGHKIDELAARVRVYAMEWFTGGKSRMDTNLDDEAAGRARHKLAAEASARRKEEKKRLVKENAEMKARLTAHRNTARTDDDVTDEASWQHRAELKKRSEERMKKEDEMLDSANDKIFAKIHAVVVKTDDDIMDEAAGQRMLALHAAGEERRQQEKGDLKSKNRTIADRLRHVRPQVAIMSKKGKRKEEAGFFIDPYKFKQPQMGPMGLIRQPGDAPTPSWLGKFEKYEWAPPGII